MHEHVRHEENINHDGAYSSGLRNYTQDVRNRLPESFIQISGKEAFIAFRNW